MRRAPAVVVFVGWTLLIWTTRISNIWRDQDLDTAARLGRTALAASFTVLAVAAGLALWRGGPVALSRAVAVLALWTTLVWLIRSTSILLGDWSGGFKAVHTLLAVVSIALAVTALRQAGSLIPDGKPVAV